MKSTSKALILIFLVVGAEASSIENKIPENLSPKKVLSSSINNYVDQTIHMLVPFMQRNGLDPMQLPTIEEGFEIKVLLITYSAWLRLTRGSLTGLVNIARSGTQLVEFSYPNKSLRVRVQLRFNNLQFGYNYLVQVMGIGPTGRVVGRLNHFNIIADVGIDFNKDEIRLQQFSITERGLLEVRLENSVIGWLLRPLINIVTRILNGLIISVVEVTIRSVIRGAIGGINTDIREVVDLLESYNK